MNPRGTRYPHWVLYYSDKRRGQSLVRLGFVASPPDPMTPKGLPPFGLGGGGGGGVQKIRSNTMRGGQLAHDATMTMSPFENCPTD